MAIPNVDLCYVRTQLKTYEGSFMWAVEKFSSLNISDAEDFGGLVSDGKRIFPLKPITDKGPFMSLILYLNKDCEYEGVCVDLLIEKCRDYDYSCEISLLDANRKVIASRTRGWQARFSWQHEFMESKFLDLISKDELTACKELFLPNDTLFLQCSFEIRTGDPSSEIEYCTPDVSLIIEESVDNYIDAVEGIDSLMFEEYFVKDVGEVDSDGNYVQEKSDLDSCSDTCPLKGALRYLHNEAAMSDASLRIGTKLFPVHQNILSFRCPAFKNIFSSNMTGDIVEIDDVDENTLCWLLQYIYTDTIGDLQLEMALKLFEAAAVYQMLDLKDKCSDFLQLNLKTNFREIQCLAFKHQDKKLKKAVEEFVHDMAKKQKCSE